MVTSDVNSDYDIGYHFAPRYVWTVSVFGCIQHICSSENKAKKLQKELFEAEFGRIYYDDVPTDYDDVPTDIISETDLDEIMHDEIQIERVELE